MQLRSIVGLLCTCLFIVTAQAAERVSPEGKWTFTDNLSIPTLSDPFDPNSEVINLPANVFVPNSADPSETFPTVIFISSWALNEYEYLDQAQLLADQGYLVLSYTARGFWSAPGLINTAGEADVNDARSVIDYLLNPDNHLPAAPDNIAMAGVSYGAGISLLTGFQDERVKVIAAMSGWGDLIESLWAGNTPNYTWLEILVGSSQPIPYVIKNRPDPIIEHYYDNMKRHVDIADTKAWGYIRSPITYLPEANARENKPAIFASNNMHDYLFQPDSMVHMLSQYQGPWRLELNRGTHASAEASGLLGSENNPIWIHLNQWLDHYLKGVDNGIDTRKPMNTIVLNTRKRESYDSTQVNDATRTFHLNPVSGEQGGSLNLVSNTDTEVEQSFNTTDHIAWSGWVTGALDHTSRFINVNEVDPQYGLMFNSATLAQPLHLRGKSELSFWAYARDKAQYFAYLLFLDPETGKANWVGHAPFSCHISEGCGLNPDQPSQLTLSFYWTAVDLPAGTQVLLVIDGQDPDYWRYDTTPEQNTLVFGPDYPAVLSIPEVTEPGAFDDPVPTENISRNLNNGSADDGLPSAGGSFGFWILAPSLLLLFRRRFKN